MTTTIHYAKPIGNPVRVSGKRWRRRTHYGAFQHYDKEYKLDDSVLLHPEVEDNTNHLPPYVAIIRDIIRIEDGSMMVSAQWLYRPYETEIPNCENRPPGDPRKLYFSFHRDEVPAESIKHKCILNFIPINKQVPKSSQSPGFVVQKVYDPVEIKLHNLTDVDFEDAEKQEIDELIQKTIARLGELPDANGL